MTSTTPFPLSQRATENIANNEHWKVVTNALSKPYDKEKNPNGVINMGLAESSLMHEELIGHFKSNFDIDPSSQLTYGSGPNGSPRLRKALKSFFNSSFHPTTPVHEDEYIVTSGVSSLTDSLTWCICNDGEGILIPRPLYTGFEVDIPMRSRGRLLPVSFVRDDEEYSLDDVFDAEANIMAFERALKKYTEEGVRVRAVLLSNPHNPLGRCYPSETLQNFAEFCSTHNLHLLMDEIYAHSTFSNQNHPNTASFTSILSLPLAGVIDPQLVHVMYGMSKDFCSNGTRLGVLHTRNKNLREAVSSITVFAWPSYIVQDLWARILEDKPFLDHFITTNRQRLQEGYQRLTNWLDKRSIPYYQGGNAAFFLWVNLSQFFPQPVPNITSTSTSTSATGEVKEHEQETDLSTLEPLLLSLCLHHKIFIRAGSAFYPEPMTPTTPSLNGSGHRQRCVAGSSSNINSKRTGWFRITFTLDPFILAEGLNRLERALVEFQGLPMDS